MRRKMRYERAPRYDCLGRVLDQNDLGQATTSSRLVVSIKKGHERMPRSCTHASNILLWFLEFSDQPLRHCFLWISITYRYLAFE